MSRERKHVAVHLSQDVYEELEMLRNKDRGRGVLTMSKYVGRIVAEYINKERYRLSDRKYSVDTDFE
jgi:hypothetical protein